MRPSCQAFFESEAHRGRSLILFAFHDCERRGLNRFARAQRSGAFFRFLAGSSLRRRHYREPRLGHVDSVVAVTDRGCRFRSYGLHSARVLRLISNRFLAASIVGCFAGACSPELVVGKVVIKQETCSISDGEGGAPSTPMMPVEDKTIEVPWSTGFENGFCDYQEAHGFCYPPGTFQLAETPVRSGKRAAAFPVSADPGAEPDAGPTTTQSRCFLEGAFPRDARYGAWFYIPALAVSSGNWNLMYFPGKNAGPGPMIGLWDVSLDNADDGSLVLNIFSHDPSIPLPPAEMVPVPIGTWVHIEFRWLRADDATGRVELRQDGVLIQRVTGIVTDRFDYHQWYVGNLVGESTLDPPDSVLYVDDVTITEP
jgi:hypothetical protein